MKKTSTSVTGRVLAAIPFLIIGLVLLGISTIYGGSRARTKSVVSPALAVPQPFSGTFDPQPYPCGTMKHQFTVPAGQVRIVVQVDATVPANDLAVTLLQGSGPNPTFIRTEDTGVGNEVLTYAPTGGVPAGDYQVQVCLSGNPLASTPPYDYTGVFTYDDTAPGGSPPPPTGTLSAPPQDPGPKIGYENFQPPGVLTPVNVTSSGGHTVEYLGRNAIEPSIGANVSSGMIHYQSDLETLFITFDNGCATGGQNSSWLNRPAPLSQFVDSDPILFTDRQTGRVFASELTLLSPDTSKIAYSDNDGVTWVPDQQAQGLASAVDHQTMGGGPYHAPLTAPPAPLYPNAVYYCSQDIATAFCSRSDDGGVTFGSQVPIYNLTTCGGLHGHVKIGPDGTVYVPNRDCSGAEAVVVSEDNGLTWTVHPVQTDTRTAAPSSVGQGDDPALSIDEGGRVYFAFSNFGSSAGVAISDDHGQTWKNMFDVGAAYGLNNVCFPTATAGGPGRAAVAFYGSTTPNDTTVNGKPTGNSNEADFIGVWHLYIAHTFDGGKSWTTSDATPLMPMQRSGLLRGGGANIVRNLADFFDMTVDKDGRILVGYGNGCDGGPCAQAPIADDGTSLVKGNAYSATAIIARQSSGRRMFVANDPASPSSVPGMPFPTQTRKGNVVRLMWNESDTGNSTITGYQILRGTAPGQESFLTTVAGTQIGGSFDDTGANDPTKTYYYKIVAVNGVGQSCSNNEIAAPYVGDSCTGIIIHKNDPTHPESVGGGVGAQPPTPQLLIDYISVGEPVGTGDLMFKMKVGNLNNPLPPNSRWRIAWDWFDPTTATQMYYVGMTTDENSNVTFEYGTLGDAGLPAVLLLSETKIADLPQTPGGTHYDIDGTITMIVPKSGVGNPQPGDLLGAIGGRTITGDTSETRAIERSTSFVDHTFIKGQSDNAYPTATYTVVGNTGCTAGTIVPVRAVSRKTHGSAGTFDIDLPLIGAPGIECRTEGNGHHQVVVTFPAPITALANTTVTTAPGKTASATSTVNGSEVIVDLTNVSNAQTFTINLIGAHDALNSGDVAIPMSVLTGDVNETKVVDGNDVAAVQSHSRQSANNENFRFDVNATGLIDGNDVSTTQSNTRTSLP